MYHSTYTFTYVLLNPGSLPRFRGGVMHIEATSPYSYTRKCSHSEKSVSPCFNHPVLFIFSCEQPDSKKPLWVVVPGTASLHFPTCVCRSVEHKLWTQLQGLWNKSFPCLNINEFRKQFFPRPKPRHEMVTILQRTEEPSINNQMESDQAWRQILQRVLSSLGPGIASPATRVAKVSSHKKFLNDQS